MIKLPNLDLERLQIWWEGFGESIGMDSEALTVHGRIKGLINQALVMQDKYHVVVTNPLHGHKGYERQSCGLSKHPL